MSTLVSKGSTGLQKALRRLFASAFASLVLASLPHEASADATFHLVLSGPGILNPQCPSEPGPTCHPEPFQWRGTVTLVTASSADGTYTGDSFHFLSVDSNLFGATSNGLGFIGGLPSDQVPASVTLQNGKVTGFDFYHDAPFELATFGGLSATYSSSGSHLGTVIEATAILSNVPEPEALALMLAGLLLTGIVERSKSRGYRWRRALSPIALDAEHGIPKEGAAFE